MVELLNGRRKFRDAARGELRRESEPERLFDLAARGVLSVPSRLVPRLAEAARRTGCRVEIQELAEILIPAATPDVADLDVRQRLVAALARSRRGVVQARSYADQITVIDLALDVFAPGWHILVNFMRWRSAAIYARSPERSPGRCETIKGTRSRKMGCWRPAAPRASRRPARR